MKLVKTYQYYHGNFPNAIFVGKEEWNKLKSEVEVLMKINEEKPRKFMGIDLYEVAIDKFLKVGNIEE